LEALFPYLFTILHLTFLVAFSMFSSEEGETKMKKSAIVSVVFAGVMIVVGFALMVGSLCSYQFRPIMGGYMMSYRGGFVGYQVLLMIFAAALFVGGIGLLCLSGYLFAKSSSCEKKTVAEPVKPEVAKTPEAEKPETSTT